MSLPALCRYLIAFISQPAISIMQWLKEVTTRTKSSSLMDRPPSLMSLPPELRVSIMELLFNNAETGLICTKFKSLLRREALPILDSTSTIWLKNNDELSALADKMPETVPLWTSVHLKLPERFGRSIRESFLVLGRLSGLQSLSMKIEVRTKKPIFNGYDDLPGWSEIQNQLQDELFASENLELLEVVFIVAPSGRPVARTIEQRHVLQKLEGAWAITSERPIKGEPVPFGPARKTDPVTGKWRMEEHTCAEREDTDESVEYDSSSAQESLSSADE
ncbi:hypothetical protein LTR56_024855 [Elasticomyces elasticus]|nr:hypothetical protein LTR22_026934 [Elasticomyces elasticus]KAK3618137.1 hypothetical protein LTR56_024855 [Elasticomyces elasticus]KAK4917548.1 hypothetical protein LTR49_014634 [Elasticomyces elasticus]KAK5756328.1 hypothetical protein LTS12_013517 [Elasticomyces elasticus]